MPKQLSSRDAKIMQSLARNGARAAVRACLRPRNVALRQGAPAAAAAAGGGGGGDAARLTIQGAFTSVTPTCWAVMMTSVPVLP